MTTQNRMDRDGKSRRNADIPLSKTIRYYSIRFHLTRFNPGEPVIQDTRMGHIECRLWNDSIAFRYPIWHMAFFFFLSFQRLEIKWKIDIQWDYWNLQGSGGRPFIWSRNKLKQIIVMFRYREWEINFIIWNILKMFESLSRNIYIL